jgi:hypothetical protein
VYEYPVLTITPEAWEKLWLYINLCPVEVGGLGELQIQPDGTLVMQRCFLVEQEVTDVETLLDPAAVSALLIEYIQGGGDPSRLQLWWHSHAREAVFWSTDDERTIDSWPSDMLVALVGNHAGKWLARQDWYRPERRTMGWLHVRHPDERPLTDGALADAVRQELERKVHRRHRHTNKPWTDGDLPKRHEH